MYFEKHMLGVLYCTTILLKRAETFLWSVCITFVRGLICGPCECGLPVVVPKRLRKLFRGVQPR